MDYHTYTKYTDSYLNPQTNTYEPNSSLGYSQYQQPYSQPSAEFNYGSSQSNYNFQNFDYSTPPPTFMHNETKLQRTHKLNDPRLKTDVANNYHYQTNVIANSFNVSDQSGFSPEIKTYDLTLRTSAESIPFKSDDELWVENWLAAHGKINLNLESTELKEPQIKLPVIRKKSILEINTTKIGLAKCLRLIEKLKKTYDYLNQNVDTMPSAEWKEKTIEIGLLKDEFSFLVNPYESGENVSQLKLALKKRKIKRLKQKKRKVFQKEYLKNKEDELKVREKQIDNWLENMKDAVERTKMEEHLKKDADCVLAEVTKKKSDARKQLSLLSALLKLRNVRETVALAKGQQVSVEDQQAFQSVTDKLTNMWDKALKSYGTEEQGLRMMLEQNASDDTKQARLAKERKITQEWELVFFGPKTIPSPAFWGLTSAERDVETFIAIRKSWDTFLVKKNEEGSQIPIGWVLPTTDASENWTKYLQK